MLKVKDPKLPNKEDEKILYKADLFLEAIRLSEPLKKQEYNKWEEDITNRYYFLQKLADEHKLI